VHKINFAKKTLLNFSVFNIPRQ